MVNRYKTQEDLLHVTQKADELKRMIHLILPESDYPGILIDKAVREVRDRLSLKK